MKAVHISNKVTGLASVFNYKQQSWRKLSLASATLVITSLFLAAPVATQAAFAFPPPPNGDSICTELNDNYCLTGEGEYDQVRTESTGVTAWNFVSAPEGYKIKPVSNSGLCLQGYGKNDSYRVAEEPCTTNNTAQEWGIGGGIGNYNIENEAFASYMGVFNTGSSRPVYDEGQMSGFDYGWQS